MNYYQEILFNIQVQVCSTLNVYWSFQRSHLNIYTEEKKGGRQRERQRHREKYHRITQNNKQVTDGSGGGCFTHEEVELMR